MPDGKYVIRSCGYMDLVSPKVITSAESLVANGLDTERLSSLRMSRLFYVRNLSMAHLRKMPRNGAWAALILMVAVYQQKMIDQEQIIKHPDSVEVME